MCMRKGPLVYMQDLLNYFVGISGRNNKDVEFNGKSEMMFFSYGCKGFPRKAAANLQHGFSG